mgnify:FL=1
MIACRAPFRISLFGGGTDFPDWYKKNNGMVIAGSINKYCYINVRYLPPVFKFNYRLRYHETEHVKLINNIKHGPYREILKYFQYEKGHIEIVHSADLPSLSGLGGSSSSTVCAIHAISALRDQLLNKKKIAKLALDIEQKKLKESVGSQDQVTAAFGGFNLIEFNTSQDFNVQNIIGQKKIEILNKSSILLFTGIRRLSEKLEKNKMEKIITGKIEKHLHSINDITEEALTEFTKKKMNLKKIGELMNLYWAEKKKLTRGVSNVTVDNICKIAMKNGAYGSKLLGSGGGGFVYILCSPKNKLRIEKKLSKYKIVNFAFENSGSTIIYNQTIK